MKLWFLLVLGLVGCYSPGEDYKDMSGNAEYAKGGGWSNSGILTNNGTSNIGLSVNFLPERDKNPIPSKGYTIQFSVGVPSIATGQQTAGRINPVAEITWSVAGNDVRRIVSVTNGMCVSGVGEGVKVVVRDKTFQGNPPTPVVYTVDITVAPGTRPSENQPATYNPTLATVDGMIIVPPFSQVVLAVPQNAGVISAFITVMPDDEVTALAPNNAVVYQVNNAGTVFRSYDPNSLAEFVPIVAQIFSLTLKNNLPVAPGVPDLQYSVTFGIDG